MFAEAEIGRQRAGQNTVRWLESLGRYLVEIAAAGQHPYLAAALPDQPAEADPATDEPMFDRAMPAS
ncbi:MAG: hypothetical protein ACRDN0_19860 [Trebonia sp.]